MSPQKRVYGNERIFLLWDSYAVCWNGHFYTTKVEGLHLSCEYCKVF